MSAWTRKVLDEIAKERQRQREKWGDGHDDVEHGGRVEEQWVPLLQDRLDKVAVAAIVQERRRLIELAAVAVAAVETIDRFEKGVAE